MKEAHTTPGIFYHHAEVFISNNGFAIRRGILKLRQGAERKWLKAGDSFQEITVELPGIGDGDD